MKLRTTLSVTIAALAFIVAAGATAQAKDSRSVLLHYDSTVAGAHLASGSYDLKLENHNPDATVSFLRGKKVVATAEAKVVDRGTRYAENTVVYQESADGSRVIRGIRFRNSSEVVVFKE